MKIIFQDMRGKPVPVCDRILEYPGHPIPGLGTTMVDCNDHEWRVYDHRWIPKTDQVIVELRPTHRH